MTAHWPKVRLGQVVTPIFRREAPIPGRDYRQIGVRLWGEGAYERESIDGGATKYQHLFRAESGDLIMNKIWARNGSVAVVHENQAGTYGSGEFPMFEPDRTKIDPQWLHWLTKLKWFWAQCDEKAQGTSGKNRITPSRFLEIEIPLPPLEEQRRIVGRIGALTERLIAVSDIRNHSLAATTALWPSVLHAILIGRGIRVSASPDTAVQLLNDAASRHADASRSPHNRAHASRPAWSHSGPVELPKKWVWTNLGSVLTHLVDCVNDTPAFSDSNTGLLGLKSTNIRPYRLDLSSHWYVTPTDFAAWNRRAKPEPGDIVLTREAPVGNACLLPAGHEVCLTQRLMLLRPDTKTILAGLLLHYLNSPLFRDQVRDLCRGLTTPHIRVQDVPHFLLPLPPLEDQHLILTILDSVRSRFTAVESLQEVIAMETTALMPSVLNRALAPAP